MNPGGVATNPLANFSLSATSNTTSGVTMYEVSLDSTNRDYLPRVIGVDCFDAEPMIFAEENYNKKLLQMIDDGYILGLNTGLTFTNDYNNYLQQWQTPETPWIVSEFVVTLLINYLNLFLFQMVIQPIKKLKYH